MPGRMPFVNSPHVKDKAGVGLRSRSRLLGAVRASSRPGLVTYRNHYIPLSVILLPKLVVASLMPVSDSLQPVGGVRHRGGFRARVGGRRRAQPGAGRQCREGQTPLARTPDPPGRCGQLA